VPGRAVDLESTGQVRVGASRSGSGPVCSIRPLGYARPDVTADADVSGRRLGQHGAHREGIDVVADQAFDALADPIRREILAVLAEHDECSAGALSQQITRVGRTAVSGHLRVLLAAGLITEERRGRYRFYAVDPDGAARDVIRLLQELVQSSLDATRGAAESRADELAVPDADEMAANRAM
jgi:ArsR family transcriptional regulator, arsenate/arsenite/antimonite-responsive transcriptional repressor